MDYDALYIEKKCNLTKKRINKIWSKILHWKTFAGVKYHLYIYTYTKS